MFPVYTYQKLPVFHFEAGQANHSSTDPSIFGVYFVRPENNRTYIFSIFSERKHDPMKYLPFSPLSVRGETNPTQPLIDYLSENISTANCFDLLSD